VKIGDFQDVSSGIPRFRDRFAVGGRWGLHCSEAAFGSEFGLGGDVSRLEAKCV